MMGYTPVCVKLIMFNIWCHLINCVFYYHNICLMIQVFVIILKLSFAVLVSSFHLFLFL